MSTILCKAFARNFPNEKIFYLKPVSTGPLEEADDGHISRFSPQTKTACLYQFDEAVSPHIAARSSKVSFLLRQRIIALIKDSLSPTQKSKKKSSPTSQPAHPLDQEPFSSKQPEESIPPPPAALHKQIFTGPFVSPHVSLPIIGSVESQLQSQPSSLCTSEAMI